MPLRRLLSLAPVLLLCAPLAAAQSPSADRLLFVKSRLSLTQYTGENSLPLLTTSCASASAGCDRQSYGAGVEVGLQATPALAASVAYQTAAYPSIAALDALSPSYASNYRVRKTAQVLVQYGFPDLFPRFTPYLQTGLHVTAGRTPVPSRLPSTRGRPRTAERWAFGPSFGAGLDLAVNHRLSLFAEATTSLTLPDDAIDGRGGFFGTDRLSGVGFGVKVKSGALPARLFNAPARTPDVLAATAPSTLAVNEVGLFAVDPGAAPNTTARTFRWDFGDGTTQRGRNVTRKFAEPGTYRVTLRRATTDGAPADDAVHTFSVRVRPTGPIRVDSIAAVSEPVRAGFPVTFRAETRGDAPSEYRWHLGDGTVDFSPEPTQTYAKAGTYTIRLQVIGAADTTSHTRSIVVHGAESAYHVQLGAFSSRARAERFARRHASDLPVPPAIHYDAAAGHHRVQLDFDTRKEAEHAVRRLRATASFSGAFLRASSPDAAPIYPVAVQ